MIFINGIEFEIREKNFSTSLTDLSTAIQNPKEFLKKHTTLTKQQIEELTNFMHEDELIKFVHKKLDMENEDTFVSAVNKFSKKIETIEYMMLSVLMGLGYKYTDLISLGSHQLIECFIIEVSNNSGKLNGTYIKKKLLEKYSESNIDALAKLMGIDNASEENDGTSEMNDLINTLNNL